MILFCVLKHHEHSDGKVKLIQEWQLYLVDRLKPSNIAQFYIQMTKISKNKIVATHYCSY